MAVLNNSEIKLTVSTFTSLQCNRLSWRRTQVRSDVFSITVVFLGLIAGSLIDMNLRAIYKNKSPILSIYIRILEKI